MSEVLQLYRQFLRTAGRIGQRIGRHSTTKLRFNVRDVFEVHRAEKDPAKIADVVSSGKTILKTLQMLSEWDSETWKFGVRPQKETTPPQSN